MVILTHFADTILPPLTNSRCLHPELRQYLFGEELFQVTQAEMVLNGFDFDLALDFAHAVYFFSEGSPFLLT